MEKAIRVVSIERGHDPREFTLVAFGGAGGLHACELAKALSIPRVIVPAMPGALSALGILVSDVVKDYSRTVLWRAGSTVPSELLEREFMALQRVAEKDFRAEGWMDALHYQRSVDVRYRGQGYELNIPLTRNLIPKFHDAHQRRYGYSHREREIELVTLRLRTTMKSTRMRLSHLYARTSTPSLLPGAVPVFYGGKKVATAVHARERLLPGRKYSGPAVITEYSATTVVPPGASFHLDRAQNLVLEIR